MRVATSAASNDGVEINMIHVLLKILVWVVVLGVGYFVFGPQSFDSSDGGGPFRDSSSELFLPPAKPDRLIDYERRLAADQLQPAEFAGYQALAKAHQSDFWKGRDLTVEKALAGVRSNRGRHLVAILRERGLSKEEQSIFLTVLQRDHPELLEDRE